jgi:methionyl-tRNA formyltransferase
MNNKTVQPFFKVVFMGTPQFAVPTLNALHESRHEIAAVVTQPDRPKGRGRKVAPPPVKERALALGYSVHQPESVKSKKVYQTLSDLDPDVFVVVAFGQIIPKRLLLLPKRCAVNLHASLLPKYRGPAPIQWAIINGDKETGVTSMCMDEGTDTGDIFLSEKVGIAATCKRIDSIDAPGFEPGKLCTTAFQKEWAHRLEAAGHRTGEPDSRSHPLAGCLHFLRRHAAEDFKSRPYGHRNGSASGHRTFRVSR